MRRKKATMPKTGVVMFQGVLRARASSVRVLELVRVLVLDLNRYNNSMYPLR